jgi:beta-phosphoglucomutase-like phosphatase (HAD superfamily)
VSAPKPPAAVVFDFNGTISDDEPLLAELFVKIFGEIGIEVTEQRYYGEFAGYSDPEIVERILSETGHRAPSGSRSRLSFRAPGCVRSWRRSSRRTTSPRGSRIPRAT